MSDFDTDPGNGSEIEMPTALEQAEQSAKSDAALERTIRESAKQAFSRSDPDAVMRRPQPGNQNMDATIRESWNAIQARPEPLQMPALPGSPSIEQTLEARQKWETMPLATKRDTVNAHSQVAAIKEAAEYFGLEIKTIDDFLKVKGVIDGDRSNGSPDAGPSQVWSKLGVDEVQSDREALARLDDFASRHGETFARNGVSVAEGLELLVAAQEQLERDPARGIQMLADAYGIDLGGAQQGSAMPFLVEEFSATKSGGISPAVRRAMAEVIQSDHRLFSSNLPAWQVLQTAYSEVKRRQAVRAKREPDKRLEDAADRAAAEVYGRR